VFAVILVVQLFLCRFVLDRGIYSTPILTKQLPKPPTHFKNFLKKKKTSFGKEGDKGRIYDSVFRTS